MTTKELISNIAKRSGLSRSQVADLLDATEEAMVQQLLDGKSVHLQGFGALEVRQKKERISTLSFVLELHALSLYKTTHSPVHRTLR